MFGSEQVDRLITQLMSWDRDTLLREFVAYPSRFPVDCTPDYLRAMPVDKVRHLFLAMCLQNRRLPAATNPTTPNSTAVEIAIAA